MGANGKINRDCTKLAVLASCPLKRGGLKPSFHCILYQRTSYELFNNNSPRAVLTSQSTSQPGRT